MTIHRLRDFINRYEQLLKEYDDVVSDSWYLSQAPQMDDDFDTDDGGDIERWLLKNYIDNLRLLETGKLPE